MVRNRHLPPTSLDMPPIGMVRVAAIVPVPQLLEKFGCDPDVALNSFGISRKLLSDSQNVMPFTDMCGLLEHCALVTKVPHFGLFSWGAGKPFDARRARLDHVQRAHDR